MLSYMELRDDRLYLAFHRGAKETIEQAIMSCIVKISTNGDYREGKKLGINDIRFAHTELIFPKSIAGQANSFSSRGMDKPSGVQFKNIRYSHPERWVFVEVEWVRTINDITRIFLDARNYVGCPYAYSNVFNTFGFLRTRKDRKGDKDWWCSEIDAKVLKFPKYKVSPNKLYTVTIQGNKNHRARG